MPIREDLRPYPIYTAAPTLGQHNREILSKLLNISDAEIAQLMEQGIIGTAMLSEEQLEETKAKSQVDKDLAGKSV
ncbi:hypothetical protein [Bradyrhizobium sp. LM6.9]